MRALKDLLVGTLVGIVSMLPGASGATIAVIFGIYERLVTDIADIFGRLLRDLRFIIPVGMGVLIGLVICAFGLDALLERWEVPMMFFFVTLIIAQVPDIIELGSDGSPMTTSNWAALAGGIAVMLVLLALNLADYGVDAQTDNVLIWVFVGIILAASKIAPGISGSSVLLAMGLFTPFMDAITEFDMGVIIPAGIGLVIGVIVTAKIIDRFLTNSRKSTYMAILGLTLGSIVTVGVDAALMIDSTSLIIQSAVGAIIGIILGIGLSRISKAYAKETLEETPVYE